MVKQCSKCGKKKSLSEFHKNTSAPDGLRLYCKGCASIYAKNYRNINRTKVNGQKKKYRQIHKTELIERDRKYYQTKKGKFNNRRRHLRNKYGITVEAHRLMYILQNGKCAICKQPTAYDKMDTDHDHITGKVRGLLCRRCNVGLGNFNDDPKILKSAARYLNERM